MERTLVILKPDAVNRALVGKVLARFEQKGLKIIAMKMKHLDAQTLNVHYSHHKGKPFFDGLVKFMSSIPSVIMVLEGKDAVDVVRRMVGSTNGREALSGTIRGDLSMSAQSNLVHASATTDEAKKEVERFFSKAEILDYDKMNFDVIYSEDEKV